jgi:hypothetical protein
MGFAALRKFIHDQEMDEQQQLGLSPAMQRMVNECPKTFYKWNDENHRTLSKPFDRTCCFWHWIGPPLKDGEPMPCLPYQRLLYKLLKERKKFIIRKARGVGMSTWLLYWLLFKALTEWKPGDRACIITGNALRLSEDLISRSKGLTQRYFPEVYSELMKQSSTTSIINGVIIEGMPLRFVSLRGYDRVRAIISDETDYYPLSQQKQLLDTIIPFESKPNSNSNLILVSTPASAFGIMRQIESDPNSSWYSMVLDYNYGLEGPRPIFDKEKLEQTRKSNLEQWKREFACEYLNIGGVVFDDAAITRAIELGKKYDPAPDNTNINLWHKDAPTVMALDPAWGSTSKYGVVITQFIDRRVVIVYAHEYSKPDIFDMVLELRRLSNQIGHVTNILIDSNNPEAISSIRSEFRKDQYSEQGIKDIIINCRKYNTPIENRLFVVPKYFSIEGRKMLQHAVTLLDNPEGFVAIPKRHESLLVALRSATADEWKLTKKDSLHNDLTDAFIMALSYYRITS